MKKSSSTTSTSKLGGKTSRETSMENLKEITTKKLPASRSKDTLAETDVKTKKGRSRLMSSCPWWWSSLYMFIYYVWYTVDVVASSPRHGSQQCVCSFVSMSAGLYYIYIHIYIIYIHIYVANYFFVLIFYYVRTNTRYFYFLNLTCSWLYWMMVQVVVAHHPLPQRLVDPPPALLVYLPPLAYPLSQVSPPQAVRQLEQAAWKI